MGDVDDDTERTANVGIACTAAVAFADAICISAAGEHSTGDNHQAAVTLLHSVNADAAKQLAILLSLKTQAQYGSTYISREKAIRAMRAAEQLAVHARAI